MTEISFGEVVTAAVDEISTTESELNAKEMENTGAAMKHYQRNVADRLRRLFDEVEVRIEQEEKEEAARIQRKEEREKSMILQILKDIVQNDPEVRSALVKCIESAQ